MLEKPSVCLSFYTTTHSTHPLISRKIRLHKTKYIH